MLLKVFPDKEKAKSLFNMALEREKIIPNLDKDILATISAENYYEIIKELATAILLSNGIKAVGENAHKEIISSLQKYAKCNDEEISILQDLRTKRNKSMYEGKQINYSYLNNNKDFLIKIIKKLKEVIKNNLK